MEISIGWGIVIFGMLYFTVKMFEMALHFEYQSRRNKHEKTVMEKRMDSDEKQSRERNESDEKVAERRKDMKMTARVDHSGMVVNQQSNDDWKKEHKKV